MLHSPRQSHWTTSSVTWLVFIAGLCAIVLWPFFAPSGVVTVKEFSYISTVTMPGETSQASPRKTLPHQWSEADRPRGNVAGYRTTLKRPLGKEFLNWGVLVPSYSARLELSANGAPIAITHHNGGSPYLSYRPVLKSLLPGENSDEDVEMTLWLYSEPQPRQVNDGFIAPVMVGDLRTLERQAQREIIFRLYIPWSFAVWKVLLGVGLLLLWLRKKNEHHTLALALTVAASILIDVDDFAASRAVDPDTKSLLGWFGAYASAIIAAAFFSFARLMGAGRLTPVRWAPILVAVLLPLAFAVGDPGTVATVAKFFAAPLALLFMLAGCFSLFRGPSGDRENVRLILLSPAVAILLSFTHDAAMVHAIAPYRGSTGQLALGLLLFAVSQIYLTRFVKSLNENEQLIHSLETRLEAKEHELAQAFEKQKHVERKQTLLTERRRIMRDMHDGLGGQLVSIIALTERNGDGDDSRDNSNRIQGAARTALEDLRLLVSSLDIEDDISGMLGTYRERLEAQLSAHDIALEWRMIELPNFSGLTPTIALQILRIMQEASTNVIKHAEASRLIVSFSLATAMGPRRLTIDILDDGVGYAAAPTNGHGLKNMKSRAEAIGAKVSCESSEAGSLVRLQLPTVFPPARN